MEEVKYLGLFIGHNGIRMDPEKVKAILEWLSPCSVTEVRKFLGFANYYQWFIQAFMEKAYALMALTRAGR